ncbi:MAG: DNA-binding protein [Elusimicrobia bacterium HGW-Elusimicrobia-1]|jgi:predicted DNA-binding protein with PD1-like motif|nr:MAG: DNA-binding protein [Elusimicrobia bacterium HGW-Elusimicrobia-1]
MRYTEGKIGRIFVARFDEGDDLLEGIKRLAEKEKIKAASFNLLGALTGQKLVVGSKMSRGKNIPDWAAASGEWEVLGFGTLFRLDGKPAIHLHTATGKKGKMLVGCLRGGGGVYITIECVVQEILAGGIAKKKSSAGLSLIDFKRGKKC